MDTRPRPIREIPCLDLGQGGAMALMEAEPARLLDIMAAARSHYGDFVLYHGDRLSRAWLKRAGSPYLDDIDRIAQGLPHAGAYLLNLSYEWTCTAGVGPDPAGQGMRLLRTLDWPLAGLGWNAVVARRDGPAGPWFDVTWPGFVGAVTALAPGRFAAAINQPPMKRFTPSCWLDWAINRGRLWRRRALPPAHLLRSVFETARTYTDAAVMLADTPLAIPALFTLSGTAAGEGCVIERTEDAAAVRPAPASCANHWVAMKATGRMRGWDSPGRLAMMEDVRDGAGEDFAWVRPPILNATTRLAVAANAGTGALSVQGFEAAGGDVRPATAVFRAPPSG